MQPTRHARIVYARDPARGHTWAVWLPHARGALAFGFDAVDRAGALAAGFAVLRQAGLPTGEPVGIYDALGRHVATERMGTKKYVSPGSPAG